MKSLGSVKGNVLREIVSLIFPCERNVVKIRRYKLDILSSKWHESLNFQVG